MIKTATRFIDHGKVRLVYSFLNYTNLESEEANISYPTLITMQDYHGSDIIMTGMTQVISVTLNPPIPTNAFDVMTDLDARAKQVFNADAETFDRIQRKFDAQDFQFARKRKIILIAFVILSAAGLFFIVRRART